MMIDLRDLEHHADRVRDVTKQLDFWRLLFIRGRRMLLLSARLFESFEVYGAWIKFFDTFLRALALYQACVLIPRFVVNALYAVRPLQGPAAEDMLARCWEMAYDAGWILNSVLAAFILVGPLAPLVIYLPVLTPSYQLCVHTTRFLLEYYRFEALGHVNIALLEKTPGEAHTALLDLKKQAAATLLPLLIRMGVSVCVISTGMGILLGSANPVLSFLAATLAVLATLVGKWLAKQVPTQLQVLDDLNLVPFFVPDKTRMISYAEQGMFGARAHDEKLKQEMDFPLVLNPKSC